MKWNGIGIFAKEDKKEKRWKDKTATFLYFMCVRPFAHAQLDNHEGIINNIKPI
jgi:hypothetical protein